MFKLHLLLAAIPIFMLTGWINTKESKPAELKYHFFEVVNGVVNPLAPLNSEPMTIEEFDLENPINCPEGTDEDCIRAWEENNTPTSTGAGDYVIEKDV